MNVAPGLSQTRRPDGAWTWTLDNPSRRNAITPAALSWIAQRCASLDGDVVVLEGAGDGFCSGFDLTALADLLAREPDAMPDAPLVAATEAMNAADATFLAKLHGFVVGAGVELACACDFRLAADDAYFSVPAARLGVVYHLDGLVRLRTVFGRSAVRRLMLAGARLDAAEALRVGAVDEVTRRGRLASLVDDLVKRLVGLDGRAVAASRRALRGLDAIAVASELRVEHDRARRQAYARVRAATSANEAGPED